MVILLIVILMGWIASEFYRQVMEHDYHAALDHQAQREVAKLRGQTLTGKPWVQ